MTYDPNIKAIPTEFKGTKFRSRLEARWALFFEQMGIRWEYEPLTPKLLDGTHYQPDFLINKGALEWPETKDHQWVWVEVKPRSLTFEDFADLDFVLHDLCECTKREVLLLSGDIDRCRVFKWQFVDEGLYNGIHCSRIDREFGNPPSLYERWETAKGNLIDFRAAECAKAATKHRFPVR